MTWQGAHVKGTYRLKLAQDHALVVSRAVSNGFALPLQGLAGLASFRGVCADAGLIL